MYGMKRDMSGSAAALATMLALTRLDFPRVVECWLAIADNAIGPKAYKPDDVVRAGLAPSLRAFDCLFKSIDSLFESILMPRKDARCVARDART